MGRIVRFHYDEYDHPEEALQATKPRIEKIQEDGYYVEVSITPYIKLGGPKYGILITVRELA